MAEGITHEGKTLVEMEKEITCAVCQEHYTEPKVLPCLHYYCKECVLKLALRTASNKPFSCPECRKDTILPEGGVEGLKTAFFVNRYKSNYYALERVHGKVEVKCEGCSDSGAKAEAFCRQCVAFICKECVKQHRKLKAFRSHEVDSLEDLKQGRAKEIAAKEPPTKKCLTHEEPLIIYCFDCNSLICRDCTVVAHKDHKFEFSKVAAPDTKTKLLEQLSPLKTAAKTLSGAVTEIQTTKQEVEAQGNSVADTIITSFNQLQLILEERKQQLLQESAKTVQEKIDKLTVQEKNLFLAHAEVQSITDYTERFVSDCSDNEVMSMHTEVKKRIEQEIEEQSQSGRNTEPVEEADMGVEVGCVEALQQLCQDKAKITRLAIDPTQCTLSTDNAESSLVNQPTTVALTIKLSNSKTTRRKCVITAQLKSLCNGSVIRCEVKRSKKTGEYLIQYTPTVRGRHELSVIIDGKQQVACSPFTMSVPVHPTRLGKPVKVWTEVKWPTGIAVNSTGEILVDEAYGDIVKLCKNGKRQVLVKRDLHGLTNVWDLATDSDDNIYCVCVLTNHIMKCNKNGGDIQVKKVDQSNNRGYPGLTIIENEVWLCEIDSGDLIVCDRNLNYKKRIKTEEYFIAICSDVHGNIYVTSRDNMIHVISKDGVVLRSFGCDSNGVKMLNGPGSICVSSQFVYVTNLLGHNVSVFTTAGNFVTSFRGHGSGDGELKEPTSVCTDSDSFVYIVDGTERVQCF